MNKLSADKTREYCERIKEEQWNKYWNIYSATNTKTATVKLTVECILMLIGDKINGNREKLKVLDLGCGVCDNDIELVEKSSIKITALDINEKALRIGLKKINESKLADKILIVKADGYYLPFKNECFDVVLSFGYGSVGSYKDIQQEINRILKPNGVAVIDFIKHINFYNVIFRPIYTLKQYIRYARNKEDKIYHFDKQGIEKQFKRSNLYIYDIFMINTYPPIGNMLPVNVYLTIEQIVGKIMKSIFSRVYIIKFIKK